MKKLFCVLLCMILAVCGAAQAAGTVNFCRDGLTADDITVSGICFKTKYAPDSTAASTVYGPVTAAEIAQACRNGSAYGINYKVTCAHVSSPVTFDAQIVFVAPNGCRFPYNSSVTFSSRVSYLHYDCIGYEFFLYCYSQYGGIDAGEYQVLLYLDGMLADISFFTVE